MTRLKLLALLGVLALVTAACGTDSEPTDTTQAADTVTTDAADTTTTTTQASDGEAAEAEVEPLSIVVTTTIWGDVVANVAGDNAVVEVLFPIGADPHDYQLSAAQTAAMQQADLVVVNGLALEEGALDVIEGLEADGANILEVAGMLNPIEFGAGGHAHDGDDPHVWMDPLRVADAVELIAKELSNLDSSVDWSTRAMAYADELRAVDAEIVTLLEGVAEDRRKLVTNHDSFGYFAERYGFEVVGTVIPAGTTLADPSSAELAELIEVLVDENINVIFAETIEPAALADAVGAEVDGVTVVELFTGSLSESGSGAETYIEFLRTNATRIADALS